MYFAKIKNGNKIYLSTRTRVRIPNSSVAKTITVEKFGEVSKLKELYDDPIAHFTEVVSKMNEEEKLQNKEKELENTITFNKNNFFTESNFKRVPSKNFGSLFIVVIYYLLEINSFFEAIKSKSKVKFSLSKIMLFLIFNRIIFPSSKLRTFKNIDSFGESFFDFQLHDIYRSLSIFAKYKSELISHIHKNINNLIKIDVYETHYDLTNFYVYTFENEESKLLKPGYSKEKSNYPIVQMGLLLDKNGIPLTYKLFPGNTNDVSSLVSFIDEAKKEEVS